MNKLLKRILTTTTLAVTLLAPVAVPVVASAAPDIGGNLCAGASLDVSGTCPTTNEDAAKEKLNGIIKSAINIFSILVGVVSVIMIIVAGLKYVTSGGDSTKTASAKDTILYAVVGLVVVALSQTIVFFVLGQTAGV